VPHGGLRSPEDHRGLADRDDDALVLRGLVHLRSPPFTLGMGQLITGPGLLRVDLLLGEEPLPSEAALAARSASRAEGPVVRTLAGCCSQRTE